MRNLKDWSTKQDHVALVMKQIMISVEGKDSIIFPSTYAPTRKGEESGYNIDRLDDGRLVATIDSEGSQANRLEPLFKSGNPLAGLVPLIDVTLDDGSSVSLLDAGHRLGDALIRSTALGKEAHQAFETLLKSGDATPIARLAPTSLVFGVWDSRDTQAKLPRIVRSIVRAWDVVPMKRSAQYNPPVDYAKLDVFSDDEKRKAEGDNSNPLAKRGFVHVPSPGKPGGVLVRGDIVRDVTINLSALRRLRGGDDATTASLRSYVLALSLLAAIEPHDGFYRQGCLLVPDGEPTWELVSRTNQRVPVKLDGDELRKSAEEAKITLQVSGDRTIAFDKELAKKDVNDDTAKTEKKSKTKKAPSGEAQ